MPRRVIDFQGIIELDPKVVNLLEDYLKQKENRLACQIANVTMPAFQDASSPLLAAEQGSMKLGEAVEIFTRKVRAYVQNYAHDEKFHKNIERVVKEVHGGLWAFTELLEGCAVELFQQIRQVRIDRWHLSIAEVVTAIKHILLHFIEDLMWAVRRLEKPLKEYCSAFHAKSKKWFNWAMFGETYLEPRILKDLKETERYLKSHEEEFKGRYQDYMKLCHRVEEDIQKMKTYPILALLDMEDQNLYVDFFRLLKMLEIHHQPKSEISVEMQRAIKSLASAEGAQRLFRIYYRGLKRALFNSSIEWKSLTEKEENFKEAQERLQQKVHHYQVELKHLMYTMSRYRRVILKSHANPYKRAAWGFTEWTVSAETARTKRLMEMIYMSEELNSNYMDFARSIARDPLSQQQLEFEAHQEIEEVLHELKQPLLSRSMIKKRSERILENLKTCDELGSPHFSTIDYAGDVLAQVMREDWKYHVLHEFPAFHQLYDIHQGLVEKFEDPTHAFRLERFHLFFEQIEEWINKRDVHAHIHEIELDMNDMKTDLQEFLGLVQRAIKEKSHDPFLDETQHKFRQQLLEYRYIFGQFFYNMAKNNHQGAQLRNQFLFVDQYFESIEHLLDTLNMQESLEEQKEEET